METLKLTVSTKELKGALDAAVAVSKKIPNDIAQGDAQAAIVHRENGYRLICAHDYFSVEIALDSMTQFGHSDGNVLTTWDGTSDINESNVLGIYDMAKVCSLLSKLSGVKEVLLIFREDKRNMEIEAGDNKEYKFDMAVPRKIIATYRGIEAKTRISEMPADQFAWFCSALSNLGKVVKPSVSKPGFGCVVMTAFPSSSKTLTLSGNSDAEGYSYIYTSYILSEVDFTALLPKNLCEAFSSFLTKMGNPEGCVEVSAAIDEEQRAGQLVFSSEKFSMTFGCMKDIFPFQAIDNIVTMARKPYCVYDTKKEEIKKTVDRLAIFAKTDEAVSEIHVLDGGTVEMIQRKNLTSNDKPARETCSDGVLSHFPEKIPSLGTSVKTDVLKNVIGLLPAKSDMSLVVCEAQGQGARRLALLAKDECSNITAVLLGLRSDIK